MVDYGVWVYAVIFLVLFAETGFVITPFLPGDSLIFAAGALAADHGLNIWILGILTLTAAVAGDACNYFIGEKFGERILSKSKGRFIKQEHLDETEHFFERHGGKTIILARFAPFVRTFAPFMAGLAQMHYGKFARYNVLGGILWTWSFLALGYFFGKIPQVQEHFTWVILGIIVISLLPTFYKLVKNSLSRAAGSDE